MDPGVPDRSSNATNGSHVNGEADAKNGPVTLPWQESGDRDLKDVFATATVVVLLILGTIALINGARGTAGNQLGGAVLALTLAAIGLFSWYGPFAGIGARISVDADGMWVRHRGWRLWPTDTTIQLSIPRHLPVSELGSVRVVDEEKAGKLRRQTMALRYEGRRLGWTRTIVDRDTHRAILIEQTGRRRRRPWWLLKCNQADELVEALALAQNSTDRGDQEAAER